jgi:hypothetical protein
MAAMPWQGRHWFVFPDVFVMAAAFCHALILF